jgi:hypothetical protein
MITRHPETIALTDGLIRRGPGPMRSFAAVPGALPLRAIANFTGRGTHPASNNFASYLLTPARLRSHFELPEFAFRTAFRLDRRTESSSGNWIGPTAHLFSRRMQSGQRTTEKQQGSEKTQAAEAEEPAACVAVRVNAGPGNRDGQEEIASGAVRRKA